MIDPINNIPVVSVVNELPHPLNGRKKLIRKNQVSFIAIIVIGITIIAVAAITAGVLLGGGTSATSNGVEIKPSPVSTDGTTVEPATTKGTTEKRSTTITASAASRIAEYPNEDGDSERCPYEIDVPNIAVACNSREKYRSLDGKCNNLLPAHNWYGVVHTPMLRAAKPAYTVVQTQLNGPRRTDENDYLPNSRDITLAVFANDQTFSQKDSHLFVSFGQLLSHDVTVAEHSFGRAGFFRGKDKCPCQVKDEKLVSAECMSIPIGSKDDFFPKKDCQHLNRAKEAQYKNSLCPFAKNKKNPKNVLNGVTHYLDLSIVYGSNLETNSALVGEDSEMEVSYVKENNTAITNQLMPDYAGSDHLCEEMKTNTTCFSAGDERNSETLGLNSLHTILVRNHNHIVRELKKVEVVKSEKELYELARKINIGQFSTIVYGEWLPNLLGDQVMTVFDLKLQSEEKFFEGYSDQVDPRMSIELNSAAFRMGHTMLRGDLTLRDNDYDILDTVELDRTFFNTKIQRSENGIENILFGLLRDRAALSKLSIPVAMHSRLFAIYGENDEVLSAHDIASIDVERGRDAGLKGYTHYLNSCQKRIYGDEGRYVETYDDLEDEFIIHKNNLDIMKSVYKKLDDVDLFVGGLAESHMPGGSIGPTFACIFGDAFERMKKGDRFYFEIDDSLTGFTQEQLTSVKKMSMSKMLCNTLSDVKQIQKSAFNIPSPSNVDVECGSLDDVDYSLFNE
ncbi:hypothetical protein SNEBB_009488 [Seison nebaliae]|nr:hypothetical protein SNEBB_009488 [Seison nebaliae]